MAKHNCRRMLYHAAIMQLKEREMIEQNVDCVAYSDSLKSLAPKINSDHGPRLIRFWPTELVDTSLRCAPPMRKFIGFRWLLGASKKERVAH